MMELAEAYNRREELEKTLLHGKIRKVTVLQNPHKFAWFHEDPNGYEEKLLGKTLLEVRAFGGLVVLDFGETELLAGDGTYLRYAPTSKEIPKKHQLLLEWEEGDFLSFSVQMYGGIWAYSKGNFQNSYYEVAREKISPLEEGFTYSYFQSICKGKENLSLKALLATEQRIPGLGNGSLQDILFAAGFHPKTKYQNLSENQRKKLYQELVQVLGEMKEKGGRNTEKDLFGKEGGYLTKLSQKTKGTLCIHCHSMIQKENYLGGSIYYCPQCQPRI